MRWLPVCLLVSLASCTSPEPRRYCVGAVNAERRILIFGDSWASHAPLANGLSTATGARVCSVGYPGFSTAKLARALRPALAVGDMGGKPQTVLVVSGINDVAGHHGDREFVAAAAKIDRAWRAYGVADVRHLEIPAFRPGDVPANPLARVVGAVRLRLVDGGNERPLQQYRAALKASGADVLGIRDFLPSYAGHEGSFVDGRHLTEAEYRRLGTYVATTMR